MIKQNEKHYNNLMDSIVITIFLVIAIILLVIPITLAVSGNVIEGINIVAMIIAISLIFGTSTFTLLYLIVRYCYGNYIIYENKVMYRNLYSKRMIEYSNIKSVEIKEERAFILGTYKSEVLTIFDEKQAIKIYINKKNKDEILNFVNMLKENL